MCFCYRFVAAVLWNLSAQGYSTDLMGKVRGSVELPCKLQPLPYPIEQIRVYWQVQHHGKDLLVAMAHGDLVETSHQDEKYSGRAELNPLWMKEGNFSLRLSNLSVSDNGIYSCIIFWTRPSQPSSILQHSKEDLKVTAEFSPPIVANATSGQVVYGKEQSLTCISQGGDQLPVIIWINGSDGTEVQNSHIHNDIQQDGEVLKVTSTITINVTSSINISCVIMTDEKNITSQTYIITLQEEREDGSQTRIVVTVVVTVILLVTTLFIGKIFYSTYCVQRERYHHGHVSDGAPEITG